MKNGMIKRLCKKITAGVLASALILTAAGLPGGKEQKVQASGSTADETAIYTETLDISTYRKDGNSAPRPSDGAHKDWIFAGWYETAECDTPVAKETAAGMKVAKFVPAELLSIRCQTLNGTDENSPSSKLRIVSTVDNLKYSRVGFELQMKKADGTTKTAIYDTKSVCKEVVETEDGVSFQYAPADFHPMANYFTTVTVTGISNANFSKGFYIRPYWETLDGTLVYGVSRYARVEDSYLGIINVPVRLYSGAQVAKGSLTVDYDSSRYTYYPNRDESYDLAEGFFTEMVAVDGEGSVTCTGETGGADVTADGMYVNLRFQLKKGSSVPEDGSTFAVANVSFQNQDGNAKTINVPDIVYRKITSSKIPVIGAAAQYYTVHDWRGSISSPNANVLADTTPIALTETDQAILREFGFDGANSAKRISVDMGDIKANNAARTVGILFPDTLDEGKLEAYAKNKGMQEKYYISVWVKLSEKSNVNVTAMTVDRGQKLQANGTEDNLPNKAMTFEQRKWTEIQIPLTYVAAAYSHFETWGGFENAQEKVFGIWFDWLMYTDAAPEAGGAYPEGTVLTMDICQAKLKPYSKPSVPGLNPGEAGSYFTSHTYQGSIDSAYANPAKMTQRITLTERDQKQLQSAGAVLESGDKTANRITIDMGVKRGNDAARAVGIFFPDTLNGRLKEYAAKNELQENAYVSVWLKFSAASEIGNTYAIVADRANKKQATAFPAMTGVTFAQDQWTELKIPMSLAGAAYSNFDNWDNCRGAEEAVFGVWFDWLMYADAAPEVGGAYSDETKLTIDICAAEVKYSEITVEKEGTAVNLTVPTTILGEDTETTYKIYRDGRLLTAGTDYGVDGNEAVFYTSGNYTVKYKLTNPNYAGTFCVCRNVKVTYGIGKAGAYFTSHNYCGAIDSEYANPAEMTQLITLSEDDYKSLQSAGAVIETGDKTANRITIDMGVMNGDNAARAVGIFFPDTLNGRLKEYAAKNDVQENAYVSVWLKLSAASEIGNTYAIVADRANKKQATAFPAITGVTFVQDQWTELKIPMSKVATAYTNFDTWDGCKGAEEAVFGVWFDWLMYADAVSDAGGAYPDNAVLTIDVCGARIVEN